ncbi:MAG: hypothetical protein ACPG8W_11075 [Candidatus Promineifilaceae bacterium]
MKTTRKKVQLRQIVAHPARDRSPLKIDDEMVQLVVQIIVSGGINDHESILVGPHEEKGYFYNLSGWRRFNALVLAIGLQEVAAADPDKFGVGEDGFTIEHVGHHLPAIVLPISAELETAVAHMVTHLYGERPLSTAFINVKDRVEQGLILTAANSGRQQPDLLGRAKSYHWLVSNGASPSQIAQRNGQSVHQVNGLLALGRASADLQALILNNTYPMGICHHLSSLNDKQAQGVERFLLEMATHSAYSRPTVQTMRKLCIQLKKFSPQLPMQFTTQIQRNQARIWAAIITNVSISDVAYAFAMAFLYNHGSKDSLNRPWLNDNNMTLWLECLMGDELPAINDMVDWFTLAHTYLIQQGIGCATCPLNQLPARQLKCDLDTTWAHNEFGMPCRSQPAGIRENYKVCLNAFAENDAFKLELPEAYRGREHVQEERGTVFVDSAENLLPIWHAQRISETLTDQVQFSGSILWRTSFDYQGYDIWQFLRLSDANGNRGYLAQRADENQQIVARTCVKLSWNSLLTAIDEGDIWSISADMTEFEPLPLHPAVTLASFNDDSDLVETDDLLLSANAEADDSVQDFYGKAAGWNLYESIHTAAQYFYAYNPETDVFTRGHDAIDGVLYDIDPQLLTVDLHKQIAVRYGDLMPEPEPIVSEIETGEHAEINEDNSAETKHPPRVEQQPDAAQLADIERLVQIEAGPILLDIIRTTGTARHELRQWIDAAAVEQAPAELADVATAYLKQHDWQHVHGHCWQMNAISAEITLGEAFITQWESLHPLVQAFAPASDRLPPPAIHSHAPTQTTDLTGTAFGVNDKAHHKLIRAYMDRHGATQTDHPFATPCGRCKFKLEGSPLSGNPTAPHCAWSKGRRKMTFREIVSSDKSLAEQFPPIWQCGQFKPNQTWKTLIPTHPTPPPLPRNWYLQQIKSLVHHASGLYSAYDDVVLYPFHFLTGRPMSSAESWRGWFAAELDAQQGDLSDEQLYTLFIWTIAEWHRLHSSSDTIPLPVDGNAQQFVAVDNIRLRLNIPSVDILHKTRAISHDNN